MGEQETRRGQFFRTELKEILEDEKTNIYKKIELILELFNEQKG